MRRYFVLLPLFLVLQHKGSSADMDSQLRSSIEKFSTKFINELDKTKSVVASPLSAEFVLALLALGTTNGAHEELLTSLGISSDDKIRSSFAALTSKLKSIQGVTLNVANKVYVKDGEYDLLPELKEDAVKVFDAGLEKVDFGAAAAAAKLINSWVEEKTNNRIKDLLSSDDFSDDTRLVFVNAIYFKGTWKTQFDPSNTMEQPFHVSPTSTVNVPMMYREDNYKYGISEGLDAQILEMSYIGETASMVIILPKEVDGLNSVLAKLAGGYELSQDFEKMHSTKVQVSIPKFKIETEIDLNSLLPKLGIKKIFDPNNSGLTKVLNVPERLYVSKAVQKAFIEVNEEGAEAAAATAFTMIRLASLIIEPPVTRFVADHPFLVLILVDGVPQFVATHRGI